ncbi:MULTISPECIES: bile acid:sodium symporter family protein [Bacillaceae]|uniref:Bile acid:sodium symporter family protein n=1 Tax=Evansella alkalicola TaxID=745819 RepID=A0ABS6JYB0_9BACI|nr:MULTISPECIES: bile acid:sodium symporter family protein [Bacillaceae]MBU9723575.1 bile acid:sodium symporter family protein [Bacillus alkalicola]
MLINKFIEKRMAVLTPIVMAIGILGSTYIESIAFLIPYLFAFMTFASSIGIHGKNIVEVARSPLPVIICLLILQVIMPGVAYGVGNLLFAGEPDTITGLVLAFTIPTAIASLIWVSLNNGNSSLTLSIVFINSLLAPLFIPFTIYTLFRATVMVDVGQLMLGLLWMIVLPTLAGITLNTWSGGTLKTKWGLLTPIARITLLVVILINGSVVAPYFKEELSMKVIFVTITVLSLAILAYFIGYFISKLMKFPKKTVISVVITSGMRNIGMGSAIAILYFTPAVALPVIVGTLFQQILASIFSKVLFKRGIDKY